MKKFGFILLLLSACLQLVNAQGKNTGREKHVKKTGWNVGLLPAISFNTDLGFQYGALANLFQYGDGSIYPDYYHSVYLEASKYTRGSGFYRIYYNSDHLLKNRALALDISYLPDDAYDFYGFNGLSSVYQRDWEQNKTSAYKSRMFYKYQRNLFRVKATMESPIRNISRLFYVLGAGYLNYQVQSVDTEKMNDGTEPEDQLPSVDEQPGLYEKYRQWGLITEQEQNGGSISFLKGGLVYDTRNRKTNPSKGVRTEAMLFGALPELSETAFVKGAFIHRHYMSLPGRENPVFAYRLGAQTTVAGTSPFYFQTHMITAFFKSALFEGLGGEKSVRGMLRNRLTADGLAFGNFELRWKWWSFTIFNQNFYVATNPFIDAGIILDEIQLPIDNIPQQIRSSYYQVHEHPIHLTYGAGLKIAMNENFILSADYGVAARKQDGESGFYINMNYLF